MIRDRHHRPTRTCRAAASRELRHEKRHRSSFMELRKLSYSPHTHRILATAGSRRSAARTPHGSTRSRSFRNATGAWISGLSPCDPSTRRLSPLSIITPHWRLHITTFRSHRGSHDQCGIDPRTRQRLSSPPAGPRLRRPCATCRTRRRPRRRYPLEVHLASQSDGWPLAAAARRFGVLIHAAPPRARSSAATAVQIGIDRARTLAAESPGSFGPVGSVLR